MTTPTTNTSYPFLRVARQFVVSYGQILSYADYLEKTANANSLEPTYFETEAATVLPTGVRLAVELVWLTERRRREAQNVQA